jgi:LAS superfamily LD-carboxypeptidase LdcB
LRAIPPKKIDNIAQNMLKPASDEATGAALSAGGNRQKQRKKTGNANLYGFISKYPLPTACS